MSREDHFKSIEREFTHFLPETGINVVRMDGKGFSHFSRKYLKQPFDDRFSKAMVETARSICRDSDVPVEFAYTQSDEISLVLSHEFYGNKIAKITSTTAALATGYFRDEMRKAGLDTKMAIFDSRVFNLKDREELDEYLAWRRGDARKNSIGMLSHSHFGTKALMGVATNARYEMVKDEWEALPQCQKTGTFVKKRMVDRETTFTHKKTGETKTVVVPRADWYLTY